MDTPYYYAYLNCEKKNNNNSNFVESGFQIKLI